MRVENQTNLDELKSLEISDGIRICNFVYEEKLEKELKKLDVEINNLKLEDGEKFRISTYPSREDYIRVSLMHDIFPLKRYVSVSDYSKLEKEYMESGRKDISLEVWAAIKGKIRNIGIIIPPGDYVYISLRSFSRDGFYHAQRGWL